MTHIEQAIRDAVKAGWEDDATANGFLYASREPQIFLDPAFWQALGKARGWEEGLDRDVFRLPIEAWKLKWHRFIDHLAEGKDAESFFGELLK